MKYILYLIVGFLFRGCLRDHSDEIKFMFGGFVFLTFVIWNSTSAILDELKIDNKDDEEESLDGYYYE